jgi:nucleotide-binding universal stress UspA family protein/quercetin dioxygenase-like cupin family protein
MAGRQMPRVLFSYPECRAVVIELQSGEELGDHHVRERAVVEIISGRVSIESEEETVECEAGMLVTFDPDEHHTVWALDDAQLLLLLAPWPAAKHNTEPGQEHSQHVPANAVAEPIPPFDTTADRPGMTESGKAEIGGAVVVGVDGSAGSNQALRWAVAEAHVRKTQLQAIHALKLDYLVEAADDSSEAERTEHAGHLSEIQRAAQDLLERAIDEIAKDADGVEIERKVVEGDAAYVLVNAVGRDDLLVVGSRGHGGFTGLLLGSVSQQCAHHAPCPVVIVHARAGGGLQ